jgi:hypothetical protein
MRCGHFLTILFLALWISFSGVPAVSAESISGLNGGVNSTITRSNQPEYSDSSTFSFNQENLPKLRFDTAQPKIIVSSALSPAIDEVTETLQRRQKAAPPDHTDIYSVPQGAIIHHAAEGITTVFDENGFQLFSAEDGSAGQVSTPRGYRPATMVHELPSGSVLYPSGNITFIVFNDKVILVEINDMSLPEGDPAEITSSGDRSDPVKAKSSGELPVTDFDPDKVFLERVALSYTSATMDDDIEKSSVQWTVPAAPKTVRPGQTQYLEFMRCADEEFYYYNNKTPGGINWYSNIVSFATVSEWNRYSNTWDMSSWIQNFNASRPNYYSRGTGINAGDTLSGEIIGRYELNTTAKWNDTYYWSTTISDQSGQTSKLNLVARNMERVVNDLVIPVEYRFEVSGDFNADSEANFIGDTIFSDFRFTKQTDAAINAGEIPVRYVYVNSWFNGQPQFKDMRIENKWPVSLLFGTQALPVPERYTFSMTNTATLTDENATKGELMKPAINDCDVMEQKLESRGWKMNFYRKGPEVTKADFNVNPEPGHVTLNSGVLHFHVGHGTQKDRNGNTTLQLLDQNNDGYSLDASEVAGKWGGNNKWVILDSCYALQDDNWGKALSTTHGIMGFKTQADVHPDFTDRFLYYAIDENKTVYDAFRWTTYVLYKETKVPKNAGGDPLDNETMVAAVIFKDSNQAEYDYLPGVENGIYNGIKSGRFYRISWLCNQTPEVGA